MRPSSARPGSSRLRPSSARRNVVGGTPSTAVEREGRTAVKVAVRIRPFNASDGDDNTTAISRSPIEQHSVIIDSKGRPENRQFNFDHVFTEEQHQSDVYENIGRPMLEEVYKGFNVCLFAYGQTGSGKTYSITGEGEDLAQTGAAGLVPRFVKDLFAIAQQKVEEDSDLTVKVTMSFLEIYNEKVRDLLVSVPRGTERESLEVQGASSSEDPKQRVSVKGLGVHPVLGINRVTELLRIGSNNRQQAETKMNEFSSRSHSIVQLTVSQVYDNAPEKREMESVVYLVDLAGSERQSKAEATGVHLEEAKNINTSLLMLGRALNSFAEGRNEFLSLRESKLTRLLSDCFGGNSKTWMLATISPSLYNLTESISTLDYATNAKKITNRALVNKKARHLELKELKQVAIRLEENLGLQRTAYQHLQKRHVELTQQVAELRMLVARSEASSQQNSGPDFLTGQITAQEKENEELRTAIAQLKEHLKEHRPIVPDIGPSHQRTSSPRNYFVGRCGLTLNDLVFCRHTDPWKLRAIDAQQDEEGVLLVEAFPIDSTEELGVPSSSPPPVSIYELVDSPLMFYIKVVGAQNVPSAYSSSVFCRISVLDDQCTTPRQTETRLNTCCPQWNCETVIAFPPVTESVLERFSDRNVVLFEIFGSIVQE